MLDKLRMVELIAAALGTMKAGGTRDRTRRNGFRLHQRSFRLNIRKNLFMEKVVHPWHGLPREVLESLTLQKCHRRVGVVIRDVVWKLCVSFFLRLFILFLL